MEQPPFQAQPPRAPESPQSDAVQTFIPYRNPPALIGYYLAIFSLIPCVGLPLGGAAIILGIKGWRIGKAHPEFRGKAHALVAMILGGLTFLANLAAVLWLLLNFHPRGS